MSDAFQVECTSKTDAQGTRTPEKVEDGRSEA